MKEFVLLIKEYENKNNSKKEDSVNNEWIVYHKRLFKSKSYGNLKDDKRYCDDSSNEVIVKTLNRFSPLSTEEGSNDMIEDFSNVILEKEQVMKKEKAKKK